MLCIVSPICTSSKNCSSGATLFVSSCSAGRYACICSVARSKPGRMWRSPSACSMSTKISSSVSCTRCPYCPGYPANVSQRFRDSRSAWISSSAVSRESSSSNLSNEAEEEAEGLGVVARVDVAVEPEVDEGAKVELAVVENVDDMDSGLVSTSTSQVTV